MTLASYLLFRNCETVLTVDLAWPAYQEILKQVANKLGRRIVHLELREIIESGGDADSVISAIAEGYRQAQASALFLPAISHDGVKLPIRRISDAIKCKGELRFLVVDGAQHLAHGDEPVVDMDCDFYLAGTHKWLRGLYPLGVGVYGHARSRAMVETTICELNAIGILSDPLMQFTSQLELHRLDDVTETVNLSGLLSAHGAALDARRSSARRHTLQTQLTNVNAVRRLAEDLGWRPARRATALQSGILMLHPPQKWTENSLAEGSRFKLRGVTATTYDNGIVRFSMPRRKLSSDHLKLIRKSLDATSAPNPL
jgi:selenocysteine lyase/cysteine desulfurase